MSHSALRGWASSVISASIALRTASTAALRKRCLVEACEGRSILVAERGNRDPDGHLIQVYPVRTICADADV